MTGLLSLSAEAYARAIDEADKADWGGPTPPPTSPPLAGRKGTGRGGLASVVVVVVTVLIQQRIDGRSVRAIARTRGCAVTEVNAVIDRFLMRPSTRRPGNTRWPSSWRDSTSCR